MQRKRTRGYYSDNIELGTHMLPVAQMKKFTMKSVIKYATFAVILYLVYIVYQKVNQASKPTLDDKYWPDNDVRNANDKQNMAIHQQNIDEKETQVELERRVKEEVNKVFEELKQKHKQKQEHDIKRDVFEDYKIENKIDDKNRKDVNIQEMVKDILDEKGVNDAQQDNNAQILQNDDLQDDGEAVSDVLDDLDLFEENEDPEKEKEELEVEKEIEEQLADAFKDAVNEAADELVNEKEKEAEKSENKGLNDAKNEAVIIPEVQQVFEKKEFKYAVNNMGRNLNPLKVQQMNDKARREALKHDTDHEFPPFVSAVRKTTFAQAVQMVASIQQLMPGRKIYIYDLDLDKPQKKQLMSYCGVKLHYFMKELFPRYVSDLDKLHWKPLVIQTALAEFGHLIWVNPGFRLGSQELAPLVHDSHENGIMVVGQSAGYSTLSATHPDMLKFIPTDNDKLSYHPHIEIRAVFIHNTPEVHENIMKIFSACALEETCLAPKGAKWQCKFDFTGRKPADCHRYDESALNILLKNWYNFDMSRYVVRTNLFKPYDPQYKPKLKTCRDVHGIRDSEL